MKQSSPWELVKVLLAVLAVLNVIALVFFNYHLDGKIPNTSSGYQSVYLNQDTEVSSDAEETASSPTPSVETETRASKPSITLDRELPEIALEDLDRIPETLHDLELLSAEDGAGKDISSSITCTYEHVSGRTFEVVFHVKNSYGESVSKKSEITVNLSKPLLLLKDDHVSLSKDSDFDPKDQIRLAIDTDGSDLTEHVVVSGTANTKKAGNYTVEYSVTSQKGSALATASLNVTVQ